jgi:cardiolipin synthase A/B
VSSEQDGQRAHRRGQARCQRADLRENLDGEYDRAYAKLARAGVRISYYHSPGGFYIHGKVIEADYATRRAKVFIGSENFSSTSLNDNRAVLSSIARTFAIDFRDGKHWP